MPLNLPHNFSAIDLLRRENIFVEDKLRPISHKQPLKVLVLNLMPIKITTEADILRLISTSPLEIDVEFMAMETHTPKNTPIEHIRKFYTTFSHVKNNRYDGFIVTGAPVEMLPFEEVTYWEELKQILDWSRTNVTSTFYICWGAQAALFHFHGVQKYALDKKVFGVFNHTANEKSHPLFRGFDDEFYAPHSRHTTVYANEILQHPDLAILSESEEAGVYIVASRTHREFYVTGHSEYAPRTLHDEYVRDKQKGMQNVGVPINYYRDNDPNNEPLVLWRSHANLLFTNWLHYFVYQ